MGPGLVLGFQKELHNLISIYEASLERTLIARKIPSYILSGGFVSLVLQKLKVLPRKKSFYLPHEFSQQSLKNKNNNQEIQLINTAYLGDERILQF